MGRKTLRSLGPRSATPRTANRDIRTETETVHRVSKKLCKIVFSELRQIPTNFDIFGEKMAKRLKLCEVHSFSTSPNVRHHTTVLNPDVPN